MAKKEGGGGVALSATPAADVTGFAPQQINSIVKLINAGLKKMLGCFILVFYQLILGAPPDWVSILPRSASPLRGMLKVDDLFWNDPIGRGRGRVLRFLLTSC